MPELDSYWHDYEKFGLGLPFSVDPNPNSDCDVYINNADAKNIALVGHADDLDLGARVGAFIVKACNEYHAMKAELESLKKAVGDSSEAEDGAPSVQSEGRKSEPNHEPRENRAPYASHGVPPGKDRPMEHPDREVQAAIVRLCDALCSYERATGRESALIIREQGGFVYRALSGKPTIPHDYLDEEVFALLED